MSQSIIPVTNVADLPLMMSARDIQRMGFSRANAYALLHQEDMPVVVVGKRRYLNRDAFLLAHDMKVPPTRVSPSRKPHGKTVCHQRREVTVHV